MTETKLDLQLTDLGNADRFAATHADHIRHSAIRGWLCWDGSRWAPDARDAVYEAALNTVRSLVAEAESDAVSRTDGQAILAHAVHSQSRQAIESMLALAARHPLISIDDDELDSDPWLLAVANGVLDLKTGTMVRHSRTVLNSYCTKAAYHVAAKCPRWLDFVQEVFYGRADLARWVQKAVGYTITGSTREQCLFFLFGSGLNGKSTFAETLSYTLGHLFVVNLRSKRNWFLEADALIPPFLVDTVTHQCRETLLEPCPELIAVECVFLLVRSPLPIIVVQVCGTDVDTGGDGTALVRVVADHVGLVTVLLCGTTDGLWQIAQAFQPPQVTALHSPRKYAVGFRL